MCVSTLIEFSAASNLTQLTSKDRLSLMTISFVGPYVQHIFFHLKNLFYQWSWVLNISGRNLFAGTWQRFGLENRRKIRHIFRIPVVKCSTCYFFYDLIFLSYPIQPICLSDPYNQGTVILYMDDWPLPSLRDFGNGGVCVHLEVYQLQQQLGLPEARSWAASCQTSQYSTTWQLVQMVAPPVTPLFSS